MRTYSLIVIVTNALTNKYDRINHDPSLITIRREVHQMGMVRLMLASEANVQQSLVTATAVGVQ